MDKKQLAFNVFQLLGILICIGVLLHMSENLDKRTVIIQAITTTVETQRGPAPITTNRYQGEDLDDWLAEHQRALDRAAR